MYAARDLEKNTMIIEYIGELIRNEVANRREKLYQTQVNQKNKTKPSHKLTFNSFLKLSESWCLYVSFE